jgi:hypothetical protein
MAEPREDRVELTDLDVITRYSLAVRAATADREDLIEALRSDLAWLEEGRRTRPATRTAAPARKPAAPKNAGAARKTTTKKATARRSR